MTEIMTEELFNNNISNIRDGSAKPNRGLRPRPDNNTLVNNGDNVVDVCVGVGVVDDVVDIGVGVGVVDDVVDIGVGVGVVDDVCVVDADIHIVAKVIPKLWKCSKITNTQNKLLMNNLMEFYRNEANLQKIIQIINGETRVSLRIVDWFVTNYAKKNYTVYPIYLGEAEPFRFKVYNDYKLKLKAYSKKRLDPFCRWERITIPVGQDKYMETTIGQLNFFKWAIENYILDYIDEHYEEIEEDMNARNNGSLKNKSGGGSGGNTADKTRKKREELSVNAVKTIKKEMVNTVMKFN